MRGGNGRVLAVAWCVLVVLGGLAGTASVASAQPDRISGIDRSSAGGNDPPVAEAGLDQSVPTNSTVFLDATGSTDPDGSISRAEYTSRWFWTVRQATPYENSEANGIAGNTTNISVGPDSGETASLDEPKGKSSNSLSSDASSLALSNTRAKVGGRSVRSNIREPISTDCAVWGRQRR